MKNSKYSFANKLSIVAAVVCSILCFSGAYYLNLGNDTVWRMPKTIGCIVIGVVISVLLFGTAFGAKLLKGTSYNFKACFIWEIISILLFLLLAVFFATKNSPFAQYFNVRAQKSEINSKLQTNIEQAEDMFAAYESYAKNRENLYKKKLESVVAAKRIDTAEYKAFGFQNNGKSDDKQINTKMFSVHADLFPTNYTDTIAYNGIKEVAAKWLQDQKNITRRWKFIGIVGVVNGIEKNTNDWLNNLVTLSQVREQGEVTIDFQYSLSFDDVKTHFTKINTPTLLSIMFSFMISLFMILPYILTIRNTKSSYGLRALFSKKRNNKGEHEIEY